jgi:hypothetical protein
VSRRHPIRISVFIILTLLLLPAIVPKVLSQQSRATAAADTESPARAQGLSHRAFTIRFKTVDAAYLLISPSLGPRGSIRAQPHQRTLTVVDTPQNLRRIAELIASFDLPPRSVEVSVQLILASSGEGTPEPTPPPIRGVIEKLNALSTRWNDYRLVGNAQVRGTEGESSSLRVGEDYQVNFRVDGISDESRIIRFKPFELERRELTVEGNERYARVMHTVLNLRDSQLFIVGASKMEQSNRALFMTITASLQRQ